MVCFFQYFFPIKLAQCMPVQVFFCHALFYCYALKIERLEKKENRNLNEEFGLRKGRLLFLANFKPNTTSKYVY